MKLNLITLMLSASAMLLAQGPRGPQPDGAPSRPGFGLDMTKLETIEGAVTAMSIGYGAQYPSIQVNQKTVKVAPVWFLLEKNFEIKVGDKLKITAAPSLQAKDPYLCAINLTNLDSGASLALRDANGVPLWISPAMAPGNGFHEPQMASAPACGVTSTATASGVVDQVTAGIGIQMPTLVLKTNAGAITLKLGPERLLQAADFEINAGDSLTVKYAVTCTGETVALVLTNSTGGQLVLRHDDGTPAWR